MANKKQKGERYMEVNVPEQAMTEVAEIIGNSEIDATILGTDEESETIIVRFDYASEERENMMEILELVDDYNDDSEEESEED